MLKKVCARQQQAVVLGARAVPDLPLATLEQALLLLLVVVVVVVVYMYIYIYTICVYI